MLAKAKIVKGGKVSIPAIYRKSLKLKEGDEIIFNLNNNELTFVVIYCFPLVLLFRISTL